MRKIVLAANAFFKGALRAIFFAFAIKFSTFNQICAARQVSAFTASRLAAKRYSQFMSTMTRHEKIDRILLHMSKNMGEIPTRPDLIAKNAGLTIEKSEAYLILDMLNTDGYAKRIMATNKTNGEESDPHFIALYKGAIFIDNGGYKRQHQISKRQIQAQKISDYVDFLVKPLGIITALCVIIWTTIQILKYLELIPSHG